MDMILQLQLLLILLHDCSTLYLKAKKNQQLLFYYQHQLILTTSNSI